MTAGNDAIDEGDENRVVLVDARLIHSRDNNAGVGVVGRQRVSTRTEGECETGSKTGLVGETLVFFMVVVWFPLKVATNGQFVLL